MPASRGSMTTVAIENTVYINCICIHMCIISSFGRCGSQVKVFADDVLPLMRHICIDEDVILPEMIN